MPGRRVLGIEEPATGRIGRLEFPLYKYRRHGANRTLNDDEVSKYDQRLSTLSPSEA